MARRTLTDAAIAALKPSAKRYNVTDPKFAGHLVRVTPKGVKTFYALSRNPLGVLKWHAIGPTHIYKLDESRELARAAIKAIRAGKDPKGSRSFQAVSDEWLERHVLKKTLGRLH